MLKQGDKVKKLTLYLAILFMICTRSWGIVNPANCSVYSRVRRCGSTTKNWTIKYARITGNKTVECFNVSKDWTVKYGGVATDWTVKAKNDVVCYVSSEEFSDMLYLAADGFTFGFILDDERCKDIIRKHPISGRIVWVSSRVVAVIIITKVATEIVYYIIQCSDI